MQVLTHSLATRVGLTDVDRQLDERFRGVAHVEFNEYARFLADALFSRLVDGSTASLALDGVDEVCWFVCAKSYCVSQERLLKSVCYTHYMPTITVTQTRQWPMRGVR